MMSNSAALRHDSTALEAAKRKKPRPGVGRPAPGFWEIVVFIRRRGAANEQSPEGS